MPIHDAYPDTDSDGDGDGDSDGDSDSDLFAMAVIRPLGTGNGRFPKLITGCNKVPCKQLLLWGQSCSDVRKR